MPKTRLLGNWIITGLTKSASGYYKIMDVVDGYTAITKDTIDVIDWSKAWKKYGNDKIRIINPKMISLIMPVFNNIKSIELVFQSIVDNLTSEDQLIIIDDYSYDGTWETLLALKNSKYNFEFVLDRNNKSNVTYGETYRIKNTSISNIY